MLRPGELSSRQVRGAATVGVGRPRSEYGTMVVLAALFWLQSTSTLPCAQRLLHVADGEVRVVGLQGPASSWAKSEIWSEVWVPSRPA